MKIGRYKYEFDFFSWIKKTELVELESVNPTDDTVRPELDNEFRTSKGRKIFGLKYNDDIDHDIYTVLLISESPRPHLYSNLALFNIS